jgi:beta-galactosidase
MRHNFCSCLLVASILAGLLGMIQPARAADDVVTTNGREVANFNPGWRFFRPEDVKVPASSASDEAFAAQEFNDTAWDQVNLPHTARLEKFDASGGNNFQGICWYRRHFTPPDSWKGRKLLLNFGAAMQVADIFLNGKKLTTHFGGYIPFTLDITSAVTFGADNVLAARLDNSDNKDVPPGKPQNQLDFTYFGGLYRDVRLDVTDRLHISDVMLADKAAGGGIFVSYPSVSKDAAVVQVQTEVVNEYPDARTATVTQEIRDSTGKIVVTGSANLQLAPGAAVTDTQKLNVAAPNLWHPNHPYLYTLHTTISAGGKVVDSLDTRIGIRTFKFDAATGLSINGEKFVSLGANRHQDHPYVGYASSDQAQYREAKLLREAGFTSIRSHYPQSPAFVDACDELGLLLIVSNPGWQFNGGDLFNQRVYQDAREMIRRDRNHPCVILWEAQLNESRNNQLYPTLQKIVHEEFPFDPCYTAGDSVGGRGANWDVVYFGRGNVPTKPTWIRELGDSVDNWSDQQSRSRVARGWGEMAQLVQAWSHVDAINRAYQNSPRLGGLDLWAGVDAYRGYNHMAFLGGPIDLFRLPKFDAYFFKSQSPPDVHIPGLNDGPMVFIANYATFQSPTMVTVFSNCQQVRLTQTQAARRGSTTQPTVLGPQNPMPDYALPHPPFTFKATNFSGDQTTMYMTGVAQPGTAVGELKAEGLIDGKVVATQTIRAPGVPAKLRIVADLDGSELTADGSDWIRVHAYICDARGTTHPYANDEITFSATGEGSIIDDNRIRANPIRAEAGIATALVRATLHAGKLTIRAEAFGLTPAETKIESIPMSGTVVPGRDVAQDALQPQQTGVPR